MGEADSALREEIEKVRERARLQALAQGLGPDAAAALGNNAVEEFCSRWGIRPEMVAPGVLRGNRPATSAGQPFREDARKVDLGASPMRNTQNPGQTQAIRIADLLKRAKDAENPLKVPAPPAAAGPPNPATTTRSGSNLSSLLNRMRTPEAAAPPPPAPPAPPPPAPARAPTLAPSAPPRSVTMSETLGGGATLTSNAERRRQVLEEFDRTYAEVQAMLEQRIGVVDIALNDASKGISGVMLKAAQGGLRQDEMEVLALDVERLREHLHTMTSLCDEFLQHMNQIAMARPAGTRPQ
jgi:hypothetical protein